MENNNSVIGKIAEFLAPETPLPSQSSLQELRRSPKPTEYFGPKPSAGMFEQGLTLLKRESTQRMKLKDFDPHKKNLANFRSKSSHLPTEVTLSETIQGKITICGFFALLLITLLWVHVVLEFNILIGIKWVLILIASYVVFDIVVSFSVWFQIMRRSAPDPVARTIVPWVLSPRHAVNFFTHKFNYIPHFFYSFAKILFLRSGLLQRASQAEIEDFCVEYLSGTSMAIFLQQPPEMANTSRFVFEREKIALHYQIGNFENTIRVVVDMAQRSILEFLWNGSPIERKTHRLQILADIAGQMMHPMVHSHNSVLYEDLYKVSPIYDRIFLHGQNLNNAAFYYPALAVMIPPRWLKTTLHWNSSWAIPPHDHKTLRALKKHSRYVKFILMTRAVYFKLVAKYDVGVNPELFFICSALHSIDHHVYGLLQGRVDFLHPGNNLQYRWFHSPLSIEWFSENRLKNHYHETPFYTELYKTLCDLPYAQDYVDFIDLSISS